MIVLGADTSQDTLTVALAEDEKILSSFDSEAETRHGALLMPAVERVLKEAGLSVGGIQLFCAGLGPGSFTGLKVGITAMRTLAFACAKPVVGVPTLDVIAEKGHEYLQRSEEGVECKICPVLDAKKGQVYAAVYHHTDKGIERESEYLLEMPQAIGGRLSGPVFFLGDAALLYQKLLADQGETEARFSDDRDVWLPKGSVVAGLGQRRHNNGLTDDPLSLSPLYLYPDDCNVRRSS